MKKCPWCGELLYYTHDNYYICSRACEYWEKIAPKRPRKSIRLGAGVYMKTARHAKKNN